MMKCSAGVEEFARLDRVRPPRGHVRIGGQGVADPDDIVVGRIQFPVGAECDRQFGQNASLPNSKGWL